MTISTSQKFPKQPKTKIADGSVQKTLEENGRLPPVTLVISPIDTSRKPMVIEQFLSYQFNSSMLIPVDSFSFEFVAPDGPPVYAQIKEGDIVSLYANDVPLAVGIIDTIEVETEKEYGEKVHLSGRDLLGQLEDNSCVDINTNPIYANATSVVSAVKQLIQNTRIKRIRTQDVNPRADLLFATEPGESRLSALQRLLEPLNNIFWMGPNGDLILGRPNMGQKPKGTLVCSREKRYSNVISIKVARSCTNIPNIILPIWAGQENVQVAIGKEQALVNKAEGPRRLRKGGHMVQKTIVVSTPQATSPQGLSDVNLLTEAGGANLLQAYAKMEAARQNQKEVIVQILVPGHYNQDGSPYQVDQVYQIEYDRGPINEKMYLFAVDYSMDDSGGQRTRLEFCRLGTIVADIRNKDANALLTAGEPGFSIETTA